MFLCLCAFVVNKDKEDAMFVDDLLIRNAKLHPKKEGLIFEGKRFTYEGMLDRTLRCAQALLHLGVKPGERVAVLSGNHYAYMELYYAVPHIGAVLTTINYRLQPSEVEYILNDCGARVLFVEDRFFGLVEPVLNKTKVEKIIVIGEVKSGHNDYESFIQNAQPKIANIPRDTDDVCFQLYTSGTTGNPKGAMTMHKNWIFDCIGCSLSVGLTNKDRYLIAPPLYHAAAGVASVFCMLNATQIVLMKDFIPDLVPVLIEKEKCTRALLVPVMINFVLHSPEVKKRDMSSLVAIIYGASPITEAVLHAAEETFKCDFWQAFGQTESVAVVSLLAPEDHTGERLRSCGREIAFCEIKIVDDDDNELPVGEVGEIIARGPMVMKGYYNLPEETARALKNGWLHTGDMGCKNEEGFIYIKDRKKDMIISGGENIYPAEVENAVAKHPAVLECAVIGVPDEKWGEKVMAIVVKKPGQNVTQDELIEFCKKNLAHYKCPQQAAFIDMLPRNPSGKVLKTILREPYWKEKQRRVN